MRKPYTTYKLFLFVSLALLACETKPILFKGPYYVRFTEEESFKKESFSDIVEIEVHVVGPAQEEDLLINYTISGDAREGVDYEIVGDRDQLVIEAGEYFGTIQIRLINNANNILRSQDVVIELKNTNTNEVGIGQGESEIGKTFTFTILDDCILGGTYKATSGSTTLHDISITSQDCETYMVSNWNIGVFNSDIAMDLVIVDNDDNTITIPEQEEEFLNSEVATIQGTGTVDPVTRQIILIITLVDVPEEDPIMITYLPE